MHKFNALLAIRMVTVDLFEEPNNLLNAKC